MYICTFLFVNRKIILAFVKLKFLKWDAALSNNKNKITFLWLDDDPVLFMLCWISNLLCSCHHITVSYHLRCSEILQFVSMKAFFYVNIPGFNKVFILFNARIATLTSFGLALKLNETYKIVKSNKVWLLCVVCICSKV